jgi:competence protein ComEC
MFFIITLSFLFGVLLYSFININIFYLYILVLGAIVAWTLNYQNPAKRGQNKKIKYIACAMIFLFLGFLRFDLSALDVGNAGPDHIAYYNGEEVVVSGVVVDEPDIRENNVKYTVQPNINGKLLVTMRLYPRFAFGDIVNFRCKLKRPEPFKGFAYDKYLAKKGIYSLCYYPTIFRPAGSEGQANINMVMRVKGQIFKLKNNFIVQMNKILPAPHSALLSGLLLGDTTGMPEYLKHKFINTGTIHIVAISGYNITIIISLFLLIAPYLYLSRRFAWLLILPTLILFVIITGAESSVVRAAIMGIIAALAIASGRLSDVCRLLVITAVIMVAVNPYILRFDVGFQLSFLATLGLVYITPRLERGVDYLMSNVKSQMSKIKICLNPHTDWSKLYSFPATLGNILRVSLTTTIGANIAVAPLLLWQFGRVSLISPLVNILILWSIPLTMAFGFVAVMVSYIFLPFGQVMGWFAWMFLEYIIEVVKLF